MAETRVFHNLALFDGRSPQLQHDRWLEVSGRRIQRVGSGPPPPGEAVDLEGRTVIPGLIDAHVHLMFPFAPGVSPGVLLSLHRQIRLNLASCIRCGVTTVRDLGATPGLIRRMKRWVAEGVVNGPRIVCANAFIIPPGAMPEQLPTFPFLVKRLLGGQVVERVSTPEAVRGAVRRTVAQGADWIKTTHSDRTVFLGRPDPPVFDDACYRALVDEARAHGCPVALHQTQVTGFRKGIALGVDTMEHAPLDALTEDDVARAVDAGIPIVPTIRVMREALALDRIAAWMEVEGERYLCPYALRQTRALLERYRAGVTAEMAAEGYHPDVALHERAIPVMMDNVRRLHAAGAAVCCGTDAGGAPFNVFGRFYEEVENLLEIGMSPAEALSAATSGNARALHLDDRLGTLEAGTLADLVVLDGDPTAEVGALRRVRMVVKEGEIVHVA